jgi:putative heme-binding domain-containing protein
MPAFDLPPEQLDALSEFVHSLNSAAADTIVPGDPQRGRAVFFGKGGCGSCHMVSGVGSATGPDLSSAGTSMTVSEIREVLAHPDRSITPGYQLVTVSLRNGSSVRGFARGRTNFDIQLQDLNGNFHLLQSEDIASVEDEQGSVMKPFAGTAEEMQDLVAYLSHLNGAEYTDGSTDAPGVVRRSEGRRLCTLTASSIGRLADL